MTRRKLTADEIDLWRKVAKQAERLHPELPQTVHPTTLPKPKPTKTPKARIEAFELGQTAPTKPSRNNLKPSITEGLRANPVQMDTKSFGRMKRGKLKPEGKLDRHGMHMSAAHPALVRFIPLPCPNRNQPKHQRCGWTGSRSARPRPPKRRVMH